LDLVRYFGINDLPWFWLYTVIYSPWLYCHPRFASSWLQWNSSKIFSGKDTTIRKSGSGLAKLWTGEVILFCPTRSRTYAFGCRIWLKQSGIRRRVEFQNFWRYSLRTSFDFHFGFGFNFLSSFE
jgi:hypothetical protein